VQEALERSQEQRSLQFRYRSLVEPNEIELADMILVLALKSDEAMKGRGFCPGQLKGTNECYRGDLWIDLTAARDHHKTPVRL